MKQQIARDLLFHVQEHRFTLPKIKVCLSELGLKFCGFDVMNIVQDYKLKNPIKEDLYDLDKWNIYEKSHPTIFAKIVG